MLIQKRNKNYEKELVPFNVSCWCFYQTIKSFLEGCKNLRILHHLNSQLTRLKKRGRGYRKKDFMKMYYAILIGQSNHEVSWLAGMSTDEQQAKENSL